MYKAGALQVLSLTEPQYLLSKAAVRKRHVGALTGEHATQTDNRAAYLFVQEPFPPHQRFFFFGGGCAGWMGKIGMEPRKALHGQRALPFRNSGMRL